LNRSLFHGEQKITAAEQVGLYRSLWERMWNAAVHGNDARAMIRAERITGQLLNGQ
jgi:hypothetical protein